MDSEYSQTGSKGFFGDIIELAALVDPRVTRPRRYSFHRLIKTDQKLCYFAIRKCKITPQMLANKPPFPAAFEKFMAWVNKMMDIANKRGRAQHFPVLVAHGGMTSDFVYIIKGLIKHNMNLQRFRDSDLHVADTYELCCKLQKEGWHRLQGCKLSMSGLFKKFCPGQEFKGQHQALHDVEAMVSIFLNSPLSKHLHRLDISPFSQSFKMVEEEDVKHCNKRDLINTLPNMSKCENAMTLSRLVRNGYSWDSLKALYSNSVSPLDFFCKLKEFGIARKVARAIAVDLQATGVNCRGMSCAKGLEDGLMDVPYTETASFLENPTNKAASGTADSDDPLAKASSGDQPSACPENGSLSAHRELYRRTDCMFYSFDTDRRDPKTHNGKWSGTGSRDEDMTLKLSCLCYGDFEDDDSILQWSENAMCFSRILKHQWLQMYGENSPHNNLLPGHSAMIEQDAAYESSEREVALEINDRTEFSQDECPVTTEWWDDEADETQTFRLQIEKVIPLGLNITDVYYDKFEGKQPICNIPLPRGHCYDKRCKNRERWIPTCAERK